MNFNLKDLNFSEKSVKWVLTWFKDFWFTVPAWLRNLLLFVVIGGGGYFLYTRVSMSYDMDTLVSEVALLHEKCSTSVIYDRYIYDVSNLIQITQTMENEMDLMYMYHEETMRIMIDFMTQHHPYDPMIDELKTLKNRTQMTKEAYDKVIQYHISIYKDWKPEPKNYKYEIVVQATKDNGEEK